MFLRNPGHGKITLLISASMIIIFLGLGCLFFFTDFMPDSVQGQNRKYIAFVLWGWALYRCFTVWTKYKNLQREDDEEQ